MKIKIIILTILIILSLTSCKEKSKAHKYKIGDKGPAGGLIFYDKGKFSEGWRYLEAAPSDEGVYKWGTDRTNIEGTHTGIGSGKTNTKIITEKLEQLGETDLAAQICEDKTYNGFSDWFLPSKEELNTMFKKLHLKGLGDFQPASYWSSSQNNTNEVWLQVFPYGSQYFTNYKEYTYMVRAVRAF